MLALTRRADAGHKSIIKIGDDIEVVVVEIRGDQVRLGIQAPRVLAVDRVEVRARKKSDERGEAAKGNKDGSV